MSFYLESLGVGLYLESMSFYLESLLVGFAKPRKVVSLAKPRLTSPKKIEPIYSVDIYPIIKN